MGKFSEMVKNKPTASINNASPAVNTNQNKIEIAGAYYTATEAAKLGQFYFKNENMEIAFPYLEFAAKASDEGSLFCLAAIYLKGVESPLITVKEDRYKAIGLLQRAAILGHGYAARLIVDITIDQIKSGEDLSRVVWWFMRAEELGVSCKDHLSRLSRMIPPSKMKEFESVYPEYMAGGRERMNSFMRDGDLYSHVDLFEGEFQVVEESTGNNNSNVSFAAHKETPSDWVIKGSECFARGDHESAIMFFQKAAVAGEIGGMVTAAYIHDAVYADDDKAGFWAKKALEHLEELDVQGQTMIMEVLAHICGRAGGKYYDSERAKMWQDSIGALAYSKNGDSTLPDENLVKAAATGDVNAQIMLLAWYTKRDEKIKAAYWCEKILKSEQKSKYYMLAAHLYHSSGDSIYEDKAAEYAQKAISSSDLSSEEQMILWEILVEACYAVYNKRKDSQSLDEAILWIEKYIKVEKDSEALARWEATLSMLKGEKASDEDGDAYVEQLLYGSNDTYSFLVDNAEDNSSEAEGKVGLLEKRGTNLRKGAPSGKKKCTDRDLEKLFDLVGKLLDSKEYKNAEAKLEKIIEDDNFSTSEQRLKALFALCEVYSRQRTKETDLKAINWAKKALTITSDEHIRKLFMNVLMEAYGRTETLEGVTESIEWSEKLLEIETDPAERADIEMFRRNLQLEKRILETSTTSKPKKADALLKKENTELKLSVDDLVGQFLQGATVGQIVNGKVQLKVETELEKRAAKGDAEAQYDLGITIWSDEQDLKKAQGWLEKSAQQGYVDAMGALALLYTDVSTADDDKAYEWSKKVISSNLASKEDKAQCMGILGGLCSGDSDSKYYDIDKAIEWYEKSLEMEENDQYREDYIKAKSKKREIEEAAKKAAQKKQRRKSTNSNTDNDAAAKELAETREQMNSMAAMNVQLMAQMQEMQKMMMEMQKEMKKKG